MAKENLEEISKRVMASYMNKAVYDNENGKRQKGLNTAVKKMSKEETEHELDEQTGIHPLDAHRILTQNGGRDKSFFELSNKHIDGLEKHANEMKYKKSKNAPGSRLRMFHQYLSRRADAHVTPEGKLKPNSKWNNPPSMHEETENLDESIKNDSAVNFHLDSLINAKGLKNTRNTPERIKKYEQQLKRSRGKMNMRINQLTKEEYELDEGILLEMDKFTDDHLDKLRKSYSTINKIDPSHPTYTKLTKKLDSLPHEHLKQLANANIKFVSVLARNRVNKKEMENMKKENFNQFMNSVLDEKANDSMGLFEKIISDSILEKMETRKEELANTMFESEELDELSKKTLGGYIKKAATSKADSVRFLQSKHDSFKDIGRKRFVKRSKGIDTAVKKLTKEEYEYEHEYENLDEMAGRKLPANHEEAHEIHLYGENDSHLYHHSAMPIVKNLQKKHAKGKYDHDLATKAWEHHARRALKKYNDEFPENKLRGTPATIHKAAKHFRDSYDEDVRGK